MTAIEFVWVTTVDNDALLNYITEVIVHNGCHL